jgi:mannose-6-phosphate isomerase-like protein (cupin superfamily)
VADYTVVNFKSDVEDMAPKFGYSPGLESRFARKNLELEKSGVGYYKLAPDFETPFGHTHGEQEEVYVVVSGSARVKIGDQVVELSQWDAIRVAPGAWRSLAGGPEGAEVLAFGAPNTENQDVEMQQGFWD